MVVCVKICGLSERSDRLNTNVGECGLREEVDERLIPGKVDVSEQNSSGSCGG